MARKTNRGGRLAGLLGAALLLAQGAFGQMYTGGNTSLNFANGIYFDFAPVVGYRYKFLDFGLSPFISYVDPNNAPVFYSYGGGFYTRIEPIPNLFAHVELGVMNVEWATNVDGLTSYARRWQMSLPVGAGYRQRLSDRVTAHASVLYDVLLDPDSPIENPVVRAGINYGF